MSKRLASGVYFGVAYTASKMMEAGGYLNPNDARPEKVISDVDRPQRLVTHGIWELPFGPGRPLANSDPLVRRLVEGWQFNG